MYWQPLLAKGKSTWLQPQSEIERQQSVNDSVCSILYHPGAALLHLSIIEVLAAFIGKIVYVDVASPDNERHQSVNRPSTERQLSINRASTERQQSINNLGCCILYVSRAVLRHLPIINVLAAFVRKRERDMVTAPIWKWESTERQRFCVLHHVSSTGCATAFIHNRSIGRLYRQNLQCRRHFTWQWASTERQQTINKASTEHQQSVNKASTLLGVASYMIQGLCYGIYP